MKLLAFILSAVRNGCAYIDLDGCLLEPMRVPPEIHPEMALAYWVANLEPTPIVKRRLALLYVLNALGVRLYLWTNRSDFHMRVTHLALGRHARLFRCAYFMGGCKETLVRFGPCMDDSPKYIGTRFADLLVRNPKRRRDYLQRAQP